MNLDVNYLAIFVSAIAFMIIGTLWYGPFFSKPWMKIVGMTPDSMKRTSKFVMPRTMSLAFISAFVTSFVLAVLLKSLLITTLNNALMLAFLAWLGFVATTMLHRVLFERSSFKLYLINASQSLAAFVIGVLVLIWWP